MGVMNAGQLDREIVIQTAPQILDSSGFQSFDWDNATSVTLWAEWLPAGTREAWHAQSRLGAYVDGVFRIYDIDPRPDPATTRILMDERVYDTKPYVEIGDRAEGLEIPVVARV